MPDAAMSRRHLLSHSAAAGVAVASVAGVLGAQHIATARTATTAEGDLAVDVRAHGAVGNGVADDTAAIQAAVDAAVSGPGQVAFPAGTYLVTGPIRLSPGISVYGAGTGYSTISSTHAGAIFTTATPGVRSYAWTVSNLRMTGPGSSTVGSVALDLDSVSTAHLRDTVISAFETGVLIRSTESSGALYNRLTNVTVETCIAGFAIEGPGSNATTLDQCRANVCTTYGVAITDSNNTSLVMCQIEGCGTGIHVTATSPALADSTASIACRFESNAVAWETANEFVRDTAVIYPAAFSSYTVIDNGVRTQHWGAVSQVTQKLQSQFQSTAGSWRFERITDGGAQFPALVVSDPVTGAGTPVTVQAETAKPDGYPFRAVRNSVNYWDVDASGNMRLPEAGYIELTERGSDVGLESDPGAPTAGRARLYLRDDGSGKTQLCARFASGTVQVISTEP